MVSLDDAVIARLKKGEEHFEVLVDPYAAADLIDGKEVNIIQSLAIDAVFKDSKKGTHASEESLQKNFGTGDIAEITKQIIMKGDIQLTTEQRHKFRETREIESWKQLLEMLWIQRQKLLILVRELN